MEFETIIGLEVHVHLSTKSKAFCSCSTEFGSKPNSQTCPLCLGLPGVLPVLNKKVLECAIKAGLALNCEIQEFSVFARKNYFYPDLPKGYQISQYELPLCKNGHLYITCEDKRKKIGITRIHIEEDAGKLIHGENLGDSSASYVDFNRTGIPLIEIVSEPDIRSPLEARLYMQKLRTIIRYIGISNCNMEEGSLRCDANISLRKTGGKKFGVKTEIKNMNSFKNVQKALEYEVERQTNILREGGKIEQETRLWDPTNNRTLSMRSKEEENDYRYFPDPDLIPIKLQNEEIKEIANTVGELPDDKLTRFIKEYNLPNYDAEVLVSEKEYALFFEETVQYHNNPKGISNWMLSELLRVINEKNCTINDLSIKPIWLAKIVELIDKGTISGKIGKEVFKNVIEEKKDPESIIKERDLIQISDEKMVEKVIDEIIAEHPEEVERYKAGENKLLGYLVGQIMKKTKGKANPAIVNKLLQNKLNS
jgi:aspartyl-tRNA(Asn)/glutamyl-tRNA(Gln) amidotransferase subunit B